MARVSPPVRRFPAPTSRISEADRMPFARVASTTTSKCTGASRTRSGANGPWAGSTPAGDNWSNRAMKSRFSRSAPASSCSSTGANPDGVASDPMIASRSCLADRSNSTPALLTNQSRSVCSSTMRTEADWMRTDDRRAKGPLTARGSSRIWNRLALSSPPRSGRRAVCATRATLPSPAPTAPSLRRTIETDPP